MKLMRVVGEDFIEGKRVLIRLDFDVPIKDGKIVEDSRLQAGMETVDFCLQHAQSVTLMGHIGRPGGKEDPDLTVKPIVEWIEEAFAGAHFAEEKFHVLENLRFESGEDDASLDFAKELAALGDVFINESFAAHHPAASTTVLPTLMPSAAGLRFAAEVDTIMKLREQPIKPLVAIIGGAKVDDKYEAIEYLSKISDAVLVGGLLPKQIKEKDLPIAHNVMLAKMNESGEDLAPEALAAFKSVIKNAKQVVWAGPVGKYEDPETNKGNLELAAAVIQSGADTIIGGGDTTAALNFYLDKFRFVSTGGGAMLELLTKGTLPTIEALNKSGA